MYACSQMRIPAVFGLLLLAVLCAADNVVKNGSFEKLRSNGLPEDWNCEVWRQAPVTLSVVPEGFAGKNALKITNSMEEKRANVFGSCNQEIRLNPDTDYIFSFKGKGEPGSEIIMICGKHWKTRKTFVLTNRWQQFGTKINLSPEELEKNGSTYLRLNSDKFCGNVLIDDVKMIPKENAVLDNGKLEGLPGDVPWGWRFFCSRNAKCSAALTKDGKLIIRNSSPAEPHVYGGLEQWIKLNSGQQYVVKIRYKCDTEANQMALGLKWQIRLKLAASPVWKDAVFRVTAPQETKPDGTIPFLFLCDDISTETMIESISIEPVHPTVYPVSCWQDQRLYDIPLFNGEFASLKAIPQGFPVLTLPRNAGEITELAADDPGIVTLPGRAGEIAAEKMPAPSAFSARTALGCDAHGLLLFAEVKDDVCVTVPGNDMWRGDSVQLRVDCGAFGADSAKPTDLEVTFSIDSDGKLYAWCNEAGLENKKLTGKALPSSLCQVVGSRKNGNYFIAARLDWKLLNPVDLKKQPYFGFTIAINDCDRVRHRDIAFLTPGLHDSKYSNRYIFAMLPVGRPVFRVQTGTEGSPDFLGGMIVASGLSGTNHFTAELSDAKGENCRYEIGTAELKTKGLLLKMPFQFKLPSQFEGRYHLTFLMNNQVIQEQDGTKQSLIKQSAENIKLLRSRLDKMNEEISVLPANSLYLTVPQKILNIHLNKIAGRFNEAKDEAERTYYAKQIAMIMPECTELFAEMEANIQKLRNKSSLPQAWSFRSSPIRLVDGWPSAIAENESGKREERPIVCVGYGHFEHIDRDITILRELAANTVQVETGPSMVFPQEGKKQEFEPNFTDFDKRYNPLLKKAWENDVKVVLLISPHYCPNWLLKKYPDMVAQAKPKQIIGFIKYEITHPKAQEMIRCYLDALISHVKNNPYAKSIHSICISNEPEYRYSTPDNPVTVRNFSDWMTKKFGSVVNFNAETGKNYSDFTAVAAAESKDLAASYVFRNFVSDTYAGWHQKLVSEIHRLWPGVPIHSKIMISFSPYMYVSGVDPERWAEFSDLNGNDNICMQGGLYASDMNAVVLGNEIQISSKKVSVANTENHIIVDGEIKPISNDHIYASVFEQLATGAATIVTWVYHDVDYKFMVKYPKEDRLGNIYMRPGNMAAHARAVLDGMRLAPELKTFMQYEPDIAFLYSPTSAILHSRNGCLYPMNNLAMQLASTGYRARALTERQLASANFGRTRLLFVAGAPNVTRTSLAGMKKFTEKGGRIIADLLSLKQDEYGRAVELGFPVERVNEFSAENTAKQIASTQGVDKLPILASAGKDGMDGILFRAVPDGKGAYLVNIMNYNYDPRKITLSGAGTIYDLITESPGAHEYTLQPRKILLLRFTPKK